MDFVSLIAEFGGFVWIIAAFVVALSIIVAVHEYGHYIVGRWCGIDADVFSLGFGPVLYSRNDRRGTRWQIALIPFGGYVKFAGDANAASGKDSAAMEAAAQDPEAYRRTMHGAPLWARAATVAAGPVFNFILSIIVFAGVGMYAGAVKEPLTVGDLRPLPNAQQGLAPGDVILAVDSVPLPAGGDWTYDDLIEEVAKAPVLDYTVERDGREEVVQGPYIFPPLVGTVIPQSAAMRAGLEEGDVITAINGDEVFAFGQLKDVVESSDGAAIALTVWRSGETLDLSLQPKRVDEPQEDGSFATNWRIGVGAGNAFEPARESLGLGAALNGGVAQTWRTIELTVSGLGHMITGAIGTCNLTGPIRIAKTAGDVASQGLQQFFWLIAVLSTAIGFFNLFPIPVLDGGHLVFHAYEAVFRRPPSDKALQLLMGAGLAMVLTLMVFALSMDVFCP